MCRARLRGRGARPARHQPRQKPQVVPGPAGSGMLRENLCPAACAKAGEEKPRPSADGSGPGAAQGSGRSGSVSPGVDPAPVPALLAKLRAERLRIDGTRIQSGRAQCSPAHKQTPAQLKPLGSEAGCLHGTPGSTICVTQPGTAWSPTDAAPQQPPSPLCNVGQTPRRAWASRPAPLGNFLVVFQSTF